MFKVTTKTISEYTGESTADSEVLSLVRIIEDKIVDAVGQKLNQIQVQLPVSFERLRYLNTKEAQKLVYGRLLQELDYAGYTSTLQIYETITLLKITWEPALGPLLKKELTQTIIKHISYDTTIVNPDPQKKRRLVSKAKTVEELTAKFK